MLVITAFNHNLIQFLSWIQITDVCPFFSGKLGSRKSEKLNCPECKFYGYIPLLPVSASPAALSMGVQVPF